VLSGNAVNVDLACLPFWLPARKAGVRARQYPAKQPSLFENDPNLSAFVASSCTTIPITRSELPQFAAKHRRT
jgi:hypothetical protein